MRYIGGDEISTILDLKKLGLDCKYVSVLPNGIIFFNIFIFLGYFGDYVIEALNGHDIDVSLCKRSNGNISEGIINEDGSVFYQVFLKINFL